MGKGVASRDKQTTITVGVPVYNGAPLIEESLQSLREDEAQDLNIVIYDNCSEDRTADIAQQFVNRDQRFHYVKNSENIGMIGNFRKALLACETEYFAWRAYDDLSNPQYFTVLKRLLEADSRLVLAAPDIITVKMAKGKQRARPFRGGTGHPARLLRNSQAAWIYGVFRTRFLKKAYNHVFENYPHLRASDHLILFHAILDGGVTGTHEAKFIQRDPGTGANSSNLTGFVEKKKLVRDYYRYCSDLIDRSELTGRQRLLMRLAVMRHINRRVQRLRKLFW